LHSVTWRVDDDDEIEIARLIVCEREMIVVSADQDVLGSLSTHIARPGCKLAAAPSSLSPTSRVNGSRISGERGIRTLGGP
jgi:hypothetical protein